MTTRNRMTWQRTKKASPPPASYGWTPEHPAFYPDPEANKYQNGDTSSWAEDPTKGPYAQGPAPASYGWVPDHPAAKPDAGGPIPPPVGPNAGGKQAALRAQVEKKASKCIRVASAILGKGASVQAVENKALTLMDLPDHKINAALVKVRQAFLTGTGPMGEDLDGDGIDQNDPEVYDYEGEMEIEPSIMGGKRADEFMFDDGDADFDDALMLEDDGFDADAEGLLAGMLAEDEGEGDEGEDDPETAGMLAEMLAGKRSDKMSEKSDTKMADKMSAEIKALKAEIAGLKAKKSDDESKGEDPMALDGGVEADDMLASLFGGKLAKAKKAKAKKSEDDESEDEEEDEEESETASKKARLAKLRSLTKLVKKLAAEIKEDEGEDEEEDEEESETASKKAKAKKAKAKKSEDDEDADADEVEAEDDEEEAKEAAKKSAAKRRAAKKAEDDEGDDDDEDEGEAEDDEGEDDESETASKKAYRSLFADDDEGEDDEDEGEDEESEVASKKASRLRPMPRKASKGVKSLGAVRIASTGGGDALSNLWKSAPDVSEHF